MRCDSRSLERDLEEVAAVDLLLVGERDLWRPFRELGCSIEQQDQRSGSWTGSSYVGTE